MKKGREKLENPPVSDIKGHFIFYFLQKENHTEDSKMFFNYGWCVFMILSKHPYEFPLYRQRNIDSINVVSYLKTGLCGVMMFCDAREITQWLKALVAMPQDWQVFHFQHPDDGLQSSVTPILGNLTPSLAFEGITGIQYTAMPAGKTHIKFLKGKTKHSSLRLSYFRD